MEFLLLLAVVAVGTTVWLVRRARAQKQRQARVALAKKLGLQFDAERDRDLAERYGFLSKLNTGSNRYAYNRFWGTYRGQKVMVFDYHYELHALEGRHRDLEYYFSCLILHLPRSLPELTISREGLSSKITQALGYDDIDFESHEFSRKFCVRSQDKRFAYDVCNARMIDYLLGNEDLTAEINRDALALIFPCRLGLEEIEPNLHRLVTLRSLLPDYLFSGSTR